MTIAQEQPRVVSASREIAAGPGRIFELIADPAQQPRWDGNDNLAQAPSGQRVRRAGGVHDDADPRRRHPGEPRGRVRRRPPDCLEARSQLIDALEIFDQSRRQLSRFDGHGLLLGEQLDSGQPA
jgi:hypothetical protein